MVKPMLRLEKIHRQATGNPILRLAAAFREGRPVSRWKDPHGRLQLLGRGEFHRLVSPHIQILCGFNKTRHHINARVREITGRGKELVAPREKLICLRNNQSWSIYNGQQVTVLDIACENRSTIELEIETDDGRYFSLPCLRRQFGHDLIKDFRSKEVALMDYGYRLTGHKAQGSGWNAVLALEEVARGWDPRRWRYTVATRAREQLIYCA
jgi:ATP-dependent exoDNAse (exonuclease V) alpha subunit